MKNKLLKLKTALLIVLLTAINTAYSVEIITSIDKRTITSLTIDGDVVYVSFKGLVLPPGPVDRCNLVNGESIILINENENPKFDEMYSLLLSAKLSEMPVGMRIKNNNKSHCVIVEVSL